MERCIGLLNPKPKGDPKRKKTKKVQILEKLEKSPESSWEEIRSSIPNPAQALKNLENEGAVVEAKRPPLFSLCSFGNIIQL